MVSVADYPPIPANILQKRSLLQGYPGLHVYYDLPIQHLPHEAKLPGKLFKGMAAAFLFYAEKPKPLFRVAIGSDMDYNTPHGQYVGQGVFGDVIAYKCQRVGETKYEKDHPIPAQHSYFWMQFLFTEDKKCMFYLEETFLGEIDGQVDNTLSDKLVIWNSTDENNCRILEMHFTCPVNDGHKFFPMEAGRWLCSRPAATFARGGSVTITGRYKVTYSANPSIGYSIYYEDTGKESDLVYLIEKPADTSVPIELIFRFRGILLICNMGGSWWYYDIKRPALKTARIRMVRNFEVENVEVSTGMNTWTSV